MEKKYYGFISREPAEKQMVSMVKGQNFAGYGVGILHLDNVWYAMVPGNVQNAWTYSYPVRYKAVTGLDTPTLHSGNEECYQGILKAAKELEKEGCRAISAACGFFGHFQERLSNDMNIPVAVSSLVQVPWIRTIIRSDQKIGILTANASALGEQIYRSCGIGETGDLVVADLRHGENFSVIMEDRGPLDNAGVRREVVNAARKLTEEYPDIGAILLECSDMPPYASAVQAEVKLPVFDFITLINWLQNAVMQRPYDGWI